jgi:hypothetical protein
MGNVVSDVLTDCWANNKGVFHGGLSNPAELFFGSHLHGVTFGNAFYGANIPAMNCTA